MENDRGIRVELTLEDIETISNTITKKKAENLFDRNFWIAIDNLKQERLKGEREKEWLRRRI